MDSAYSTQIDSIDKETWHGLLLSFDDASFYQTWSYGAIRWGINSLSHVVLRRAADVVSMAQLRIVRFPVGLGGIAYLPWGPIWRARGSEKVLDHLQEMLIVLRKEYVVSKLTNSDLRGYEIGDELGFQDDLAFYRWVKRAFGVSLKELRTQVQSKKMTRKRNKK